MTAPEPERAATELLHRLASYEELHVLLDVFDAPGRARSAGELSARHPAIDVPDAVAHLVEAGVLVLGSDGAVSLAPDPGLEVATRALAERFRSDPLPILRVLTERALDRVRTAAARTFADAFVVRRRRD